MTAVFATRLSFRKDSHAVMSLSAFAIFFKRPHGAGVGDEVARDQAQQRGLAAAVGADEAGPFAVADGEGNAGQQRFGGEGETEEIGRAHV